MNSVVFLNFPKRRVSDRGVTAAYIQKYFIKEGTMNSPCVQGSLLLALCQLSIL